MERKNLVVGKKFKCLLFLDIDGVLNISAKQPKYTEEVSENLIKILKETDCGVVISSSWRLSMAIEDLIEYIETFFRIDDFRNYFVDVTPSLNSQRGLEIMRWIETNKFDGKFAILDDYPVNEFIGVHKNFIKTYFPTGITDDIAQKTIQLLNEHRYQ